MMNDLFNMSLPYRQMVTIRVQNSKYGEALVIETSESSGKYLLGFRIDPISKLAPLATKIRQMWKIAYENPIYGVNVSVEDQPEV
jgi:Bardet-Biedl syndrome 5 protein